MMSHHAEVAETMCDRIGSSRWENSRSGTRTTSRRLSREMKDSRYFLRLTGENAPASSGRLDA